MLFILNLSFVLYLSDILNRHLANAFVEVCSSTFLWLWYLWKFGFSGQFLLELPSSLSSRTEICVFTCRQTVDTLTNKQKLHIHILQIFMNYFSYCARFVIHTPLVSDFPCQVHSGAGDSPGNTECEAGIYAEQRLFRGEKKPIDRTCGTPHMQ